MNIWTLRGVIKSFTLDAKGASTPKSSTEAFKLKASKKIVAAGGAAKYLIKLKLGTFAALMSDEGMTNMTTPKPKVGVTNVVVPVIVIFNGGVYKSNVTLVYKSKQDKKGTAKKAR